MLIDEQQVADEISKRDAHQLALADECVAVGTELLARTTLKVLKRAGITQQVVHVTAGLLVKATRLLRATRLLYGRGLAAEGDILVRTLFETLVAVRFVLKPRVTLRENGTPLAKIPGKPLTTHFRACLYFAHQELEYQKGLVGRRGFTKKDRQHVADRVDLALKTIGTEWAKRLKGGNYAGVHLRALCGSIGIGHIYDALYRPLSWAVHARDASSHVQLDLKNNRFIVKVAATLPSDAKKLESASMLYVYTLALADARLDLELKAKVDDLAQRLSAKST